MMPPKRIQLVVDTDIGTNVDDCLALAYLLREPACDLLGITTVTGEPGRRAALAKLLCEEAGRGDISVHIGAAEPLNGNQQQLHATLADDAEIGEVDCFGHGTCATAFLAGVAAAQPGEVTLLCIGPLTNIAALLRRSPNSAKQFKKIVMMGGCFTSAPVCRQAETNMRLDPTAASEVFGCIAALPNKTAPLMEGLGYEATTRCTLALEELSARCPTVRLARLAGDWLSKHPGSAIGMHDALAAIHAVAAESSGGSPVSMQRGTVGLDAWSGNTSFACNPSGRFSVANGIDCAMAKEQFFRALSAA